MNSIKYPKDFYQQAAFAAETLREFVNKNYVIRIFSHIDADGLAAASIIAEALFRMEALFSIRIEKQLDERLVEELDVEDWSPIIFTDFGSGVLNLLKSKFSGKDIIIMDHHQPQKCSAFPKLIHVNPHLFGFDGAKEISGSGVAYVIAKAMDISNIDLAYLAVIGALGDCQDRNEKRKLRGLNQKIVKDAINTSSINVETDLIFYGRETRPLHKALAYTTDPFMPGLSGEEDKCFGFLTNLGIELKVHGRWRAINDLGLEEKQKIFSEIVKHLSINNLPNSRVLSLIGTVYTLTNEERGSHLRDAREYASLLNACGRMNKSGLGIAIGVGNRGSALKEAKEVLYNYRKTLAKHIEWVTNTPHVIEKRKNIYVINGFDMIDEKILGTITSILISSGIFRDEKPVIALTSTENNMVKISGRIVTTSKLNLGLLFREATLKYQGTGGGHDVAAGAQVHQKFADDFIQHLDHMVGAL